MRIIYFGSPDISAQLLGALLDSDRCEIVAVVSNPDRPRGRSGAAQATAVSALALARGLPLYRWENLRADEVLLKIQSHSADLGLVFAYGKLIPMTLIEAPRLRMANLHASLLPELRGASPIQSALLAGLDRTGWSLQSLSAQMDAGDILAECQITIDPDENAAELTERMMPLGIELVLDSLADYSGLLAAARPQDHARATYCQKISTADALIDWRQSAAKIHNLVRSFHPAPVARTHWQGAMLKIWRSQVVESLPAGAPAALGIGQAWPAGKQLVVRCGEGALALLELQQEGRRRQDVASFLNGLRASPPIQLGAG